MSQEDVKIMKDMGLDSYRFSISWPRILPSKIFCINHSQYPSTLSSFSSLSLSLSLSLYIYIYIYIYMYIYISTCNFSLQNCYVLTWHLLFLITSEGKLSGGVNKAGIEYYNNLINELVANG